MLHGHLAVPGRHPVTIAGEVVLVNGELRADVRERPRPTTSQLTDVVGALIAIATRFERPPDLPARLASGLAREPQWRVRLQGLDLLATSYPNDQAALAALRHALADENAEVRLHAAIALGEEGEATLLEIASSERRDDATAARAVHALGDRMPPDVAMAVLRQTLRLRHLQTAAALIDTLGQLGGAEVVTLMVKVLLVESGPMAVAAAQALGKAGTREVEEALLSALVRDVLGLRLAVIEALGHIGTVRAVLPIEDAAARPDSDTDVRSAARQAVAEIQSRLPGASPGQLSIADGEAGHLSLADDDPRGRVSLPEER
jgi:HEAT repeat protein